MTDLRHATAECTVGEYLAARLEQLGTRHIFGLPGDFNLALIDEMLRAGAVEWVGSTNELNAAYAADGYARIRRGLGVVLTTFGVGELSAVNGVAGSYAESVPVLHVVGMPSRSVDGQLLHHTLADGDFTRFATVAEQVTARVVVLGGERAAEDIDSALEQAVSESRPVYLGVPSDVAVSRVPSRRLARRLRTGVSDADQLASFRSRFRSLLDDAGAEVAVLAGAGVHRGGAEAAMRRIAARSGVSVALQSTAKTLIRPGTRGLLGVYAGAHTDRPETRTRIDEAPLLVLAGVAMTDFLTGFFTHGFSENDAIELGMQGVRVGSVVFDGVTMSDALDVIDAELTARETVEGEGDVESGASGGSGESFSCSSPAGRDRERHATASSESAVPRTDAEGDAPLDHAALWPRLEGWIRPRTTVIAEAGTAFYGAVGMDLPDGCEFLGQPIWSSIGYTIPALLGSLEAAPGREHVLIIGDGSAQLTVQELGTILHRGHAPTIFLLDNDGYTVERLIRSPRAVYQDVHHWDWAALPSALGAPGTRTASVRTIAELERALADADGTAATFIHVVLPRMDAPELLTRIAAGVR
ncbi:alpha-keto acid decarboxylase family protein [Mycetocola reblochoni]|uniref:Alpha-keto-acid decarboxylase n=2 Tax=Mycetocola reblochoni TaxID=331618 RepID=A0A1R4ITX7_9MICO|nr:thiamine pyrophosphate-binding protein [Mycetocola reblochoni]RLP71053.1 alpha-keto acid decarboxylase family protein [Mycetocola reblochoni]SJN23129.1 Pyruvate decarboxylase; Alpha-keto-acid decarboxylase [Mycetocola reblochoni REB411]